jgi:hypothetical protein
MTDKNKVFTYLDVLRQSGITNMFGAVPYIQRVFPEVTRKESFTLLAEWMDNFEQRHPRNT